LIYRYTNYIIEFLPQKGKKRGEFMRVIKIDEMNLYDYVMVTFDRVCDLTEGRRISLNYYLNNVNAKHVNVALFKSVFEVGSLDGILRVITDVERFDELHNFGNMCFEDDIKKENNILATDKKLNKVPIAQ